MMTSGEHKQLSDSIDKLFHYLCVFTNHDIEVGVLDGTHVAYSKKFRKPSVIQISPTLYTREDDCHGAGVCCMVPFDLIYTDYCRDRIINFNAADAVMTYGLESARVFDENRTKLLASLKKYTVIIERDDYTVKSNLWIQQNTAVNKMSGRKSCPYLFTGDDRYFCGVHLFKPLHCWMPHMTIRTSDDERPSVSIGRMQYGRNHKFGCPVIFTDLGGRSEDGGLFNQQVIPTPDYFAKQFKSDLDKLQWISDASSALGFTSSSNFAVGLPERLRGVVVPIKLALDNGVHEQIQLRRN